MVSWLKQARVSKGFTQETIARQAGIAKTTYASYEQGQRNPSIENAKILAKILGFSWTIFFENRVREESSFDRVSEQEVS